MSELATSVGVAGAAAARAPSAQVRRYSRMRVATLAAIAALWLGSAASYLRYRSEQGWVTAQASRLGLAGPTPEQTIRSVQHYIRSHIRYQNAPVEGRAFLRADAREILRSGLGYCGEATRAFIALAHALGIPARRINLYGPVTLHVVPEVRLPSGRWVLADIQENPVTNPLLDRGWVGIDELLGRPGSPFNDYSTINLRRLPVVNAVLSRIRLRNTGLAWVLENPELIEAWLLALLAGGLMLAVAADRVLARVYAWRFGVHYAARGWRL